MNTYGILSWWGWTMSHDWKHGVFQNQHHQTCCIRVLCPPWAVPPLRKESEATMNQHQAGSFLNTIHRVSRCFSLCLPLTMPLIARDIQWMFKIPGLSKRWWWHTLHANRITKMWCNSITCWDWLVNHVESKLILQNFKTLITKN